MKLINADKVIETLRERKKLFCKNHIEFRMLPPDQKARVDEIDTCIAELVNAEEFPTTEPDADTISRAKAIEAVNSLTYPSSLVDVKRKLADLPPAQPAQPEIIYCKGCKYYEADITANPWGVCCHKDWTANNVGHDVDEDGWCYRAERREVTVEYAEAKV